MEAFILTIIVVASVLSISMIALIGSYILKWQKMKLEHNNIPLQAKTLQKQMGNLLAENEALKDRIENIEYLLLKETEQKPKIKLSEYEKEQIRLDKKNDWNY
jgi:Tfp pilus assembly protein PilN